VEAIFLEAGSKAWSSSGCDASLETVEALSQKFVGVRPLELTRLVLDVSADASVAFVDDDLTD